MSTIDPSDGWTDAGMIAALREANRSKDKDLLSARAELRMVMATRDELAARLRASDAKLSAVLRGMRRLKRARIAA